MLLNEILNSKFKIEIVERSSYFFMAYANISELRVEYEAERGDNVGEWEIVFGTYEIDKKGIQLSKSRYDITGTGKELQVLAVAKDCTLQFVKIYKPSKIIFTAEKDNGKTTRSNVYEKIAKRWAIPGYIVSKEDHNTKSLFSIERKNIVDE